MSGLLTPPPLPALTPGHALTLWSADGLPSAVKTAMPLLRELRPRRVQLHAGPLGLRDHAKAMAEALRRELPGVRFWVGVAWDGWIDQVDDTSVGRLLDRVYLPAARAAHALGAELFVLNSEAAGKLHPARARLLACEAIDAIRAECQRGSGRVSTWCG